MKVANSSDNFTFELTPEKLCAGGPYMWGNPEIAKLCSKYTPQQLSEYNCGVGFHGAPVHWERTDMSDKNWENHMCDAPFNDNIQVL